MGILLSGPSQLAVQLINETGSEAWRERCLECNILGWDVLRKLLTPITNCLLSNKVKNAQIISKGEDKRELKKLRVE